MGLGIDAAGIVEEVGSEVTEFKQGDRVYGVPNYLDGSYTEYLAAKSDQFALMPHTLTFDEAGSLPACARMAWSGMVEKAKVKAGQRVLVHGGGGRDWQPGAPVCQGVWGLRHWHGLGAQR